METFNLTETRMKEEEKLDIAVKALKEIAVPHITEIQAVTAAHHSLKARAALIDMGIVRGNKMSYEQYREKVEDMGIN